MKVKKPTNIPVKSQLISGIGASSWFYIEKAKKHYVITRYSEEGVLECSGRFKLLENNFDIDKPFQFTYLSHCKKCTIKQNNVVFNFISCKE